MRYTYNINKERSPLSCVEFGALTSRRRSMGYSPLSHASFITVGAEAAETTPSPNVYSSSASLKLGCMSGLQELFSSLNSLGGPQNPERHRRVTQRKRVDADTGATPRTGDSGTCGGRFTWRSGRERTGSGCFCSYCFCGSCLSLFRMRARSRRHSAYRSTQVTLAVDVTFSSSLKWLSIN